MQWLNNGDKFNVMYAQTLTGRIIMYGKNVTVDGITVFVFGCPHYTQDQWEEKARKIIANMKEDV